LGLKIIFKSFYYGKEETFGELRVEFGKVQGKLEMKEVEKERLRTFLPICEKTSVRHVGENS
jgi:hypothetical protein